MVLVRQPIRRLFVISVVDDDWVLQADRGKLPCAICKANPPPSGLPYRAYDGVQVFVCDSCDDRIQPRDGDLDDELWQRAIDESVVSRARFLTYAE